MSTSLLLLVNCSPSEDAQAMASGVDEIYLRLVDNPTGWNQTKQSLAVRWDTSQVPMILETQRLSRNSFFARNLFDFLNDQTGKDFGTNRDKWQNWLWSQNYQGSPDYPSFKSKLYQRIDPKFGEYFDNKRKATIRLDEVVWGGVLQDGIPPLRNPRMIPAASASYLADSDLVFGIEVEGEARAYPKRILAWHEMFVDTIRGIPLAGVY